MPARQRSSPAATATDTVNSNTSSSERPASSSAWTSPSVTRYAWRRTLLDVHLRAVRNRPVRLRVPAQLLEERLVARPHGRRRYRLATLSVHSGHGR